MTKNWWILILASAQCLLCSSDLLFTKNGKVKIWWTLILATAKLVCLSIVQAVMPSLNLLRRPKH